MGDSDPTIADETLVVGPDGIELPDEVRGQDNKFTIRTPTQTIQINLTGFPVRGRHPFATSRMWDVDDTDMEIRNPKAVENLVGIKIHGPDSDLRWYPVEFVDEPKR